MKIKLNPQKELERRKKFLLFPVWSEDEILWLETVEYYWRRDMGDGGKNFYFFRLGELD